MPLQTGMLLPHSTILSSPEYWRYLKCITLAKTNRGRQISPMRYVVVKPDGRFVRLLTIPGSNPPTTYTIHTVDPQDAHDFRSRANAERWILQNGAGVVAELTNSGYWPAEE